jgi:hypothetical protein
VAGWERVPEVLWRRSGPRRVLDLPSCDEVVVLDRTGSAIWDLLESRRDDAEIVAAMSDRFATHPGAIEDEVASFLEELRATGAVRRA